MLSDQELREKEVELESLLLFETDRETRVKLKHDLCNIKQGILSRQQLKELKEGA